MARFDPNKPQKIRTTTGRGTTEQLRDAPRRYDQMTAAQKKAYRLKTLGAKGEAARAKRIASVKPASTVTAPGAPAPKPVAKPAAAAAAKPVVNRKAPEGGWYPRSPSTPKHKPGTPTAYTGEGSIAHVANPEAYKRGNKVVTPHPNNTRYSSKLPNPKTPTIFPQSKTATRVPTDSGTLGNRRRLTDAERAALRADYERKGIFP